MDIYGRTVASEMTSKGHAARKQISAVLPIALHKRAKKAAVDEQITASELLERAITAYLRDRRPAVKS